MGTSDVEATGLGQRLQRAMAQAGYKDDGGKYGVQVQRFSMDHRIPVDLLYKWLMEETVPSRANLIKLAGILGTTPGLLLFGPELERAPKKGRRLHPIAGGSGELDGYWVASAASTMPLIRHWLRRLSWLCGAPAPSWCPA